MSLDTTPDLLFSLDYFFAIVRREKRLIQLHGFEVCERGLSHHESISTSRMKATSFMNYPLDMPSSSVACIAHCSPQELVDVRVQSHVRESTTKHELDVQYMLNICSIYVQYPANPRSRLAVYHNLSLRL